MRSIVFLCLLAAAPLSAETIMTQSKITAVTVYPQGAKLTRVVAFSASAGAHELLITDLPQGTDPQALRLLPDEGVEIGASVLRNDRLPPRDVVKPAGLIAAEAALEAANDGVTGAQLALDGVRARVEAAQAQIAYLSRLGATDAKVETEVLQATARMIGAEVLAASQAALAARADFPAAERALRKAQEGQARAQAALEALAQPAKDYAALSLAILATEDGAHRLEVTQFVEGAAWSPLYDIALDRKAGTAALDRALLVSQSTGEDWTGIALTLSTAQPGNRPDPTQLWPQLHRVDDPAQQELARAKSDMGGMAAPMMEPAAVESYRAGVQFQGDIVSYAYPVAVDIADGAENLRLALDQITLPATVQARAVPRYDATAFVMAKLTNDSGQILLPGPAYLTRDGALVGQVALDTVAPGGRAELGFGAVEGLRLKRVIPTRAEGDRGLFSKSNQIEETAVLSVENLTDEAWTIRVMEVVPHSEQEDLVITFVADPPVTEADVEGKRGVLAWDWKLGAGKTQEFRLSTRESWPEGKELNGGRY